MKKILTLFAAFTFSFYCSAQIQCIKCYNQNARVIADTNNLIVNGGFEISTCPWSYPYDTSFCPNSHLYHCDIANWTCTGGGIATYTHIVDSSFSTIVEGRFAVYFGNGSCCTHACSTSITDTSCVSQTGCEVTGIPTGYPVNTSSGLGGDTGVSLSQTINGLTIGVIYILEFWAGGEDVGTHHQGLFAVDAGFGKIFMRDPPTPTLANGGGIGTRYVIVFAATSTSHTIKFTNWGHIAYATELVLDDVRLLVSNGDDDPCATVVNEVNENGTVGVFPNPNIGDFTISFKQPIKNCKVEIFNTLGERVGLTPGPSPKERGEEAVHLDVPAGVYIVKVSDGERQWFEKVIVE